MEKANILTLLKNYLQNTLRNEKQRNYHFNEYNKLYFSNKTNFLTQKAQHEQVMIEYEFLLKQIDRCENSKLTEQDLENFFKQNIENLDFNDFSIASEHI